VGEGGKVKQRRDGDKGREGDLVVHKDDAPHEGREPEGGVLVGLVLADH
jgi:hypothetical protein